MLDRNTQDPAATEFDKVSLMTEEDRTIDEPHHEAAPKKAGIFSGLAQRARRFRSEARFNREMDKTEFSKTRNDDIDQGDRHIFKLDNIYQYDSLPGITLTRTGKPFTPPEKEHKKQEQKTEQKAEDKAEKKTDKKTDKREDIDAEQRKLLEDFRASEKASLEALQKLFDAPIPYTPDAIKQYRLLLSCYTAHEGRIIKPLPFYLQKDSSVTVKSTDKNHDKSFVLKKIDNGINGVYTGKDKFTVSTAHHFINTMLIGMPDEEGETIELSGGTDEEKYMMMLVIQLNNKNRKHPISIEPPNNSGLTTEQCEKIKTLYKEFLIKNGFDAASLDKAVSAPDEAAPVPNATAPVPDEALGKEALKDVPVPVAMPGSGQSRPQPSAAELSTLFKDDAPAVADINQPFNLPDIPKNQTPPEAAEDRTSFSKPAARQKRISQIDGDLALKIIRDVEANKNASPTRLRETFNLTPGGVTKAVTMLEESGLVEVSDASSRVVRYIEPQPQPAA